MNLVDVIMVILGAIIVSTIGLIYWLIRPYSVPIVKKYIIIDKYEIKGGVEALSLGDFGGFMAYNIPDEFKILVLMENGDKFLIKISQEQYDALEIDDLVKVTEYSQIRKLVEKNSHA